MKKIIWVLLIAMVTLVACNEEPEEEETETVATPVEVADVALTDFTETRTLIGRMMPSDQMPAIPQFAGEVDELMVKRGDTVEEGDVLAEIVNPRYGRTELEAPMDGQIQQLNMVQGRAITNENPAAMIVAIDPLKLSFNVPSNELKNFSVDEELDFTVSQLDEKGTAKITYIADTAGETGTFNIEAEVENPGQKISAGVTAQVLLEKIIAENVLTVPTEAVVEREGETVLYKVEDNKAVRVPIEVVAMQSERTAIRTTEDRALEQGNSIVVRGQLTLSDGQEIRVVEEGQ
ncbi:efflux RND transporter periplasmic adaptor subunit [Filobacillus milosensis]|uniref:Efflux RND transporter periplasmic adaptor subunit n=1 Tax=Filobacillus milosensis TaxID=94137 RepID=A0A4Y8IG18_9BACI|nr:efflux RND transporter periplasmic adaptor subunit [Filobacillus milosensis]TFB19275.1 efflux RND transporter periplasmic adaptor subunit [Filobacillus milosensis]